MFTKKKNLLPGSAALGAAAGAGAAPAAPASIEQIFWPGFTVVPSSIRSSVITPATGDITGTEVLSVSTSATGSSSPTESPTSLIHLRSPSVILSANGGTSANFISPLKTEVVLNCRAS